MGRTRLILDFPAPGPPVERLDFGAPAALIRADSLDEVRPVLRQADAAAAGGAWVVGFVAYEAAPAFDPAMVTHPHRGPAPLAWFGVCDAPRRTTVSAVRAPASCAWRVDAAREEYDVAIRTIRDAIGAGDVYQVNHTLRFRAPCDADPSAWYDALVAQRHGRYHALIETPEWAIVSASPELFLDITGRRVTTRPMKGTVRRGRWLEEDVRAARALAHSAKDRAENLMIVDLLRNDLGRVARFGSVHVASMFDVETYPTVHQLTSTIECVLRDDVTLDDVFAATFPCGSVTGAPKIAAMQAIARLERAPRGPYCGAIGVLRPDGTATFNVAIRTLLLDTRTRTAVYGAGGGITWDSTASAEYDEAVAKTSLLHDSTPDFALLETMRLEHGCIPRLELHLERLRDSAHYWGFPDHVSDHARRALCNAVVATPAGAWRLRMTASRAGEVHITRTTLDTPERSPSAVHTGTVVALALRPVYSDERLLCHKTTARAVYDDRRADHDDVFDVLLWNERRELTEFTTGNVVLQMDDGALLTPARSAGLLAGTFREQLLRAGIVREAAITLGDLSRTTRIWLINSVRGWIPVRLRDTTISIAQVEAASSVAPP